MSASADSPAFDAIDWDSVDGRRRVALRSKVLLLGIAVVAGLWVYNEYVAHVYLVFDWVVGPLEWLFLLSLVVFGSQVVVPMVQHPRRTVRVWRRFRRRPEAVVGLVILGALFVGGVLGPIVHPLQSNPFFVKQPPVFGSIPETSVVDCAGAVVDGRCQGSMRFLLGTDDIGHDVLAFTLAGARTALYIALITGLLIVPLATLVGLIAGYRGGLVDDILMAGVDVQQTLPAAVMYLVLVSVFSRDLWLLVVAFGVFSWGTVARLVRSEARQRSTAGYVLAARGMGAGALYTARRHLLPNVSNTVVTAMAHLVPLLVLTEAGITYLQFGDIDAPSWGQMLYHGLHQDYTPIWEQWWVATPAAIALAAFIVSSKLVGDGLRDALDPRGDR